MGLYLFLVLCIGLTALYMYIDSRAYSSIHKIWSICSLISALFVSCNTKILKCQCDEVMAHGASVGETPAEVVKKCNITIAILSDPAAALPVLSLQTLGARTVFSSAISVLIKISSS